MPDQGSQLPHSLTLNGADYFLLQLDKLMWQSSGKRNVCTFVVTLPERLSLEDLQHQLANRPAYQWLCRLRLSEGLPFCLAKWKLDAKAELPALTNINWKTEIVLPDSCYQQPWIFNANQHLKSICYIRPDRAQSWYLPGIMP